MKASASSGAVTVQSTPKTCLVLFNTGARRAKLLQIIFGFAGAPTDDALYFAIRRITADGAGTSVATFQQDAADGAPVITAKANYTTEPTFLVGSVAGGFDIVEIGMHKRNTVIWTPPTLDAAPAAATGTTNGLAITFLSGTMSSGVSCTVTAIWDE